MLCAARSLCPQAADHDPGHREVSPGVLTSTDAAASCQLAMPLTAALGFWGLVLLATAEATELLSATSALELTVPSTDLCTSPDRELHGYAPHNFTLYRRRPLHHHKKAVRFQPVSPPSVHLGSETAGRTGQRHGGHDGSHSRAPSPPVQHDAGQRLEHARRHVSAGARHGQAPSGCQPASSSQRLSVTQASWQLSSR